MKSTLIKDCAHGKAGASVSGPSVWRLTFPVKGCCAKPADAEAIAAVESDLATVTGHTRERLLHVMQLAGSWPIEHPKQSEPEPVVVEEVVTEVVAEVTVDDKVEQVPVKHKRHK